MFFQQSLSRLPVRPGIFNQAQRILCCGSDRSFYSLANLSRGLQNDGKDVIHLHDSITNPSSRNLCLNKLKESVSSLFSMNLRSYIHSDSPKEIETGRGNRSMDFVRGILAENGKEFPGSFQPSRFSVEQNADLVHIKMIRNNTFVTVTDSKGNKKVGASLGCLSEMKGGPKASRYAAEATAEHIGRLARNMGLKSIVMKVNGFTYFKKKKQAILSFQEGYTNSRGDQNPIVYIEDTTRRPHNGCRLRKKRRV